MRGIIGAAGHLPHWRLPRESIGEVLGGARRSGSRTVASYDEDSLTLAVEAGRRVLRGAGAAPSSLWFATTSPTYVEKTNATIAHAALRLPPDVLAADAAAGLRGAAAALRAALRSTDPSALVLAGDVRTGPAGSPEEATGGDAGAAVLVGEDGPAPVVAAHLGGASATSEFLDRWRAPGELRTHAWEERFGERRYAELAATAWDAALEDAGVATDQVRAVAISAISPRAGSTLAKRLAADGVEVVDDLTSSVGHSGAAHPLLLLASLLERAEPGQVVALVSLADGADVFVFRTTDALADRRRDTDVSDQLEGGDALTYAAYLRWRGVLPVQPPNRPEPARMSAAAAERRSAWKYGFVGSRDRSSGSVHLPPARVSAVGGAIDEMDPAPMADVPATVATFTVDSLAYSPSPPVVFAVADFEGGGRLPVELTDVRPADVSIGMTVEMTFRRLNTADGIANYFWKARPASPRRSGPTGDGGG
jgi:3-hydroxy-3-methylglutaryl CoA synthase/uncharacterized OB-fold protein